MSLIRKPFELKPVSTIKVLIYGQPGIGKSTLALSAPSPIFFDFDGGVHRIKPEHLKDTVQIESWQNMLDVLSAEDLSSYRTIVIDTAGKMLDFIGAYLISKNAKLGKANGALSLQGYGERKGEFSAFLKRVSLMGKNLVFVAHDKEEKEGEQKIIRPEIGGSSGGDLIKELDLVGYMEAIGKKRTISFDPCEKFYGKNTCSLDPVIELPNLDAGKANTTLTAIFGNFQKSLETRKKIGQDYNELIELIENKVAEVTDAETANDFADWAGHFDAHIWDSKLQAAMRLKGRAEDLALVLKSKKYENAPATV